MADALAPFDDGEVLTAIGAAKDASAGTERSVKDIELEAILAAPEGFGDDVPVNPDFHARRLPDALWRRSERIAGVETVIQLHRLREVVLLAGFTRFEAVTPDIHGEYETDVERAAIALEPSWFPAVENRGEGLDRRAPLGARAGARRSREGAGSLRRYGAGKRIGIAGAGDR